MNKIVLFCCLFFIAAAINAQDAIIRKLQTESSRPLKNDIPDTVLKKWKGGGSYGLTIGQSSQSNWAGGGDDFSFNVNSALTLFLFHKNKRHSWDNSFSANFGYLYTTSLGSRKNDDRFDFLSKYGFSLNKHLNLATLVNFRSQFLKGYTYPNNVKTYASDFLSPAYLVVSQGVDYKPDKYFSLFLSPVTSRWIFVADTSISSKVDYGVKPGHYNINQNGAFATIGYQKPFNKYISYKARIDLFSNYQKNPQNIDVFVTNTLSAKIAKVLAFTWNIDMIYDDDVRMFGKNDSSPALQFKSIFGIGLNVKI
jgi:Protein of unknown function (DUF3078)